MSFNKQIELIYKVKIYFSYFAPNFLFFHCPSLFFLVSTLQVPNRVLAFFLLSLLRFEFQKYPKLATFTPIYFNIKNKIVVANYGFSKKNETVVANYGMADTLESDVSLVMLYVITWTVMSLEIKKDNV